MARRRGPKRDPEKLAAIARAARHVLTANGLRLTQVAEVAGRAGLAAGTVYLYVAEKEALIELALLSAARFELPSGAEVQRYDPRRLEETAAAAVAERLVWPRLVAALAAPPEPGTLRAVLEETYDLLSRERLLIAFLDRCAAEVPTLGALYFEGVRHRFFCAFEALIRRLAEAGLVRRDLDLAAAARATLEMLVWMAMRRPGDPEPPACDEAAAREASLAFAVAGLEARQGQAGIEPQR